MELALENNSRFQVKFQISEKGPVISKILSLAKGSKRFQEKRGNIRR
jgi:hypothetical protein